DLPVPPGLAGGPGLLAHAPAGRLLAHPGRLVRGHLGAPVRRDELPEALPVSDRPHRPHVLAAAPRGAPCRAAAPGAQGGGRLRAGPGLRPARALPARVRAAAASPGRATGHGRHAERVRRGPLRHGRHRGGPPSALFGVARGGRVGAQRHLDRAPRRDHRVLPRPVPPRGRDVPRLLFAAPGAGPAGGEIGTGAGVVPDVPDAPGLRGAARVPPGRRLRPRAVARARLLCAAGPAGFGRARGRHPPARLRLVPGRAAEHQLRGHPMTSVLKLPHLWRTLKEADLAGIRRDAERRFEVLVVSADGSEAAALAALMTGAGRAHPWLTVSTPDEARARSEPAGLDAAILVSGAEDLAPQLLAAGEWLRQAGVPVVSVVHGVSTATGAIARPGEAGRVAVPAL